MPEVEATDLLGSRESHVYSSADEEAVEFLLASALAKLWRAAYRNEAKAVAEAQAVHGEPTQANIQIRGDRLRI